MRHLLPLLPWLMVLGSCGSPPRPPSADESLKRPANTTAAIEIQVCKNDLQNTRILAAESGRLAESTTAILQRLAARQQALAAFQAHQVANNVFTVLFNLGSTRVVVPPATAAALLEDARAAPLVLLRGRTDGEADTPVEGRIARERAAAVRAYLVSAGVDAARIRTTYQPVGDHTADNTSASGRGRNRRVEIEVYRALPVVAASALDPSP